MRIERKGAGAGRGVGRRSALWTTLMVASLALTGACSTNPEPDPMAEPVPPTLVRVENQAFLDMTIYVYRSSQRVRLGTATGNSVTRLRIPSNLIFGATALRFQADPIGGNRTPITQEITVAPGDEVVLTIPPNY